jgi:short-subunit dehydrogenase
VNAISIMRLVHAFGRQMVAGGRGCIVLIGSTAAARPAPHLAAYSASKAFLLQLTKALAVEWRPHGVRIVYLVTGPIATLFAERAGLPSPRRGRDPAKVAAAVLAVCRSGRSGVAFSDWGARVRALLYAHLPDAFLGTMALGSEASSS